MKMPTTTPVWLATATVPDFPTLASNERADVCVIGAGIAGLTTAYMLLRSCKTLVIIDAVGAGASESGRSAAHFFPSTSATSFSSAALAPTRLPRLPTP